MTARPSAVSPSSVSERGGTEMSGPYDDIIHLPHHVSAKRRPMSRAARAAQFAPFAALSGLDGTMAENARLTSERITPDPDEAAKLDLRMQFLSGYVSDEPCITVTYFVPDRRKSGGEYVTVTGNLRRIEETERRLLMTDGKKIPIDEIIDIGGEIFRVLNEI